MTSKNPHQKKQSRPLKDLILLFSVPFGVIIFAAALVYMPQQLANPKYDFIYSSCSDYICRTNYSIDASGKLVDTSQNDRKDSYYDTPSTLLYYNLSKGVSYSITPAEVADFTLSNSPQSPDGYTLKRNNSSSSFLFWNDSSDSSWVLEKGLFKKRLYGFSESSYYSDSTKFLGWVIHED